MKKIVVCVSVLLLCCGMNSAIGQTQFIENEGCQDDLSMTTPKFKEVSSPLDTLKNIFRLPKPLLHLVLMEPKFLGYVRIPNFYIPFRLQENAL